MTQTPGNARRIRRPFFRTPLNAAMRIAIFYVCMELLWRSWAWLFGLSADARQAGHASTQSIELLGLTIAAGFYALYRVVKYHPQGDVRYSRWLATTPWTRGMPLPMGPINLVWEDLIPLTALVVTTQAAGGGVPFFVVFTVGYTGLLLTTGTQINPPIVAYITAFGWAGIVLLWDYPYLVVALSIALLIISQIALRIGLVKFPWQMELARQTKRNLAMHSSKDWGISPLAPPKPLRPLHSWGAPVLVGWVIFCALSRVPDAWNWDEQFSYFPLITMGAVVVGFGRWLTYCNGFQPPITTWGRLWTLRWIIPGYDYVCLAPLATTLIGILTMIGLKDVGMNPPIVSGGVAMVVLMCALNLPPTLRSWQLTGHHRIVAPKRSGRSAQRKTIQIGNAA